MPLDGLPLLSVPLLVTGDIRTNERRRSHYSEKEPDFGHLPRFSEQLPDLRDSLQSGFLDLLLLIFLNVVLFMASYLAFLRYDVR